MEMKLKTAREILLENVPTNCVWEDMDNLTNVPIEHILTAMELYTQQYLKAIKESNLETMGKLAARTTKLQVFKKSMPSFDSEVASRITENGKNVIRENQIEG